MSKLLDQSVDHGVSQILNSQNQWAWELWRKSLAAHWSPFEAKMADDIKQWKNNDITPDEKLLVKRILGLFSAGESLVSNSIFSVERKFLTDGCVRQYLGKKDFEECYVAGTEVLTSDGWIPIENVTTDTLVAQYSYTDVKPSHFEQRTLSFVKPTKVVSYDHDGDIVKFESLNGFSLSVTENHRMLLWDMKNEKHIEELSQNAKFSNNKFITTAKLSLGPDKLDKISMVDRLKIAIQADAHISNRYDGSRSDHVPIVFWLKKERKKERLLWILNSLSFKYVLANDDSGYTKFTVYVPPNEYTKEFDWVDLKDKSCLWCIEFIDEVVQWDGHKQDDNNMTYDSTNEYNVHMVSAIATCAGYSTNIGKLDKGDYKRLHRCLINLKRKEFGQNTVWSTKQHYKGKTYCIAVPSTYFIVRGNKVPVVCGNTLHNATVMICSECFDLNPDEVAEAYKSLPTVKNKTKFLKSSLDSFGSDFNINSNEGRSQFIRNMYIVYMLMEGTWFFSAFAAIMCLGRQNKLPGLYEQIDYTLADETRHVEFGTNTINQLKEEYPKSWTKKLEEELVRLSQEAIDLELAFLQEAVPNGILGISLESHMQYAKFLLNKRMSAVGLPKLFEGLTNPYTWISETQDANEMENFFETTVRNYQSASALEDDF